MWFLGLVHPKPSPELEKVLKPGYALSVEQLHEAYGLVLGTPITLEHQGVFRAYDAARLKMPKGMYIPTKEMIQSQLNHQSKVDPTHTAVGRVVDYFGVPNGGFYIIYKMDDDLKDVEWMIINGAASGLSLTHVENPRKQIIPYEVSLCFKPRRPHCYSVAGFTSLQGALSYKRRLETGVIGDWSTTLERPTQVPIMADMETETPQPKAASKTPLESAIGTIPEENRKLIESRMAELMRYADEAEKKQVELEGKNTELSAKLAVASQAEINREVEANMLKTQLDLVTQAMGAERCSRHQLEKSKTDPAIDSHSYDNVVAMSARALKACSVTITDLREQLASKAAPVAASSRKRESEEMTSDMYAAIERRTAPVEVEPAAAAAPVAASAAAANPNDPRELLRRAMANTARSFRGTAMSAPIA